MGENKMSRVDLIERNHAKKLLRIEQTRNDYQSDPNNRDKFRCYLNTLHSAGEYSVVKDLIIEQLANMPNDPALNFEMGLIQMKMNDRIQAMHSFRKVLTLIEQDTDLFRSAEFELWNLDPAFVPSWVM